MKPIVVTPGEPAGIGPDILIQAANLRTDCALVAITDENMLQKRAEQLGYSIPSNLAVIHMPLPCAIVQGHPNPANASALIQMLKQAAEDCVTGKYSALVTGPLNKAIIIQGGIPFRGHTECLAQWFHVQKAVMLFVTPTLKMALYTTHIPLREVPDALTRDGLKQFFSALQQGLCEQFGLCAPRFLICGLNPHAGEDGYLGKEEKEILIPVLQELRQEHYLIEGPLGADSVFLPQQLKKTDVVIALYHDQGLPVLKAHHFGEAVNVTLGLPFIRTSVDHGTAFTLAGTGKADASSLIAAIDLAKQLALRKT